MNHFFVYILKCSNGRFYTGHTDNLELRLSEHKQRKDPKCYTATRLPIQLVFHAVFESREAAFNAEMKIKGWSREKKEALINGDWEELKRLSNLKNDLANSQSYWRSISFEILKDV